MASHRKPSAQTYDPRTVKEHIVETPLNEEMSKSFLEYAYSVIYARALPDARDGLKPVTPSPASSTSPASPPFPKACGCTD